MALRQDLKGPRPVKTPIKRAFLRMVWCLKLISLTWVAGRACTKTSILTTNRYTVAGILFCG